MIDKDIELITVKEASEILKVSSKAVTNYIDKGFIEAFKFDRAIRINKDSLFKFLENTKIGGNTNEQRD